MGGYRSRERSMTISNTEFDAPDDIVWAEDEDHSPCWAFRAEVQSTNGWPLFVRGTYNPLIPALSYVLILKTTGRIYGLDLGKGHHNPQCQQVGDKHKHRWTEQFRDKAACVPEDRSSQCRRPAAGPSRILTWIGCQIFSRPR